jgi:hypothetical protein
MECAMTEAEQLDALSRITAAHDVASALADLAIAARALPAHLVTRTHGALLLLAECQAALLSKADQPEAHEQRTARAQVASDIDRLAYHWRQLRHLEPSERIGVIRARTGWSKSKIYRLRAAAAEAGVI